MADLLEYLRRAVEDHASSLDRGVRQAHVRPDGGQAQQRKHRQAQHGKGHQQRDAPYRREITWSVFDEKANRVANMLLSRGIRKGQKVAI